MLRYTTRSFTSQRIPFVRCSARCSSTGTQDPPREVLAESEPQPSNDASEFHPTQDLEALEFPSIPSSAPEDAISKSPAKAAKTAAKSTANGIKVEFFPSERRFPQISRWRRFLRDNPDRLSALNSQIHQLLESERSVHEEAPILERIQELQTFLQTGLSVDLELIPFGSLVNGTATRNSDLDVRLTVKPPANEDDKKLPPQQPQVESILEHFRSLDGIEILHHVNNEQLRMIRFQDQKLQQTCDLSFSTKDSVVLNSQVIRAYTSLDPRVKQLMVLVKLWAKAWNIADAHTRTLCSYGYILMTLHFLQQRRADVHGILPALPLGQPSTASQPVTKLPPLLDDSARLRKMYAQKCALNSETVGELFVEFLYYHFLRFDWSKFGVSASRISATRRHPLSPRTHAMLVFDVLDYGRNIAWSVSPSGLTLMKAAAMHTIHVISTTGTLPISKKQP